MSAGRISLETDGPVARIVIENVARRNAMSVAMWRELAAAARRVAASDGVRVVVVRGAGDEAFCAGADITDFESARNADNARAYDDLVEEACLAIEAIACPSIAMVHGACMGAGVSIAAACDLRVVSRDAFLAVPAARLGLGYDPRGVRRFLRVYGAAASHIILLTLQRLTAERAHALGAAHAIAPAEKLAEDVRRLAEAIASAAPMTLAAAKAALGAYGTGDASAIAEALRLYAAADASEDYAEGRRAFAEKRSPDFKGR